MIFNGMYFVVFLGILVILKCNGKYNKIVIK